MPSSVHRMKQHDLGPTIEHVLMDRVTINGQTTTAPINLTGCTVTAILRFTDASVAKVIRTATIVAPATDGRVQYTPTSADSDTAGTLEGEWQITGGAVGKRTVPPARADNWQLVIDPDLDNA